MSNLRKYARNLAANWIGYFANLAVVFFLSPFVVHSLGEVGYGVWSLLVSLTGYLGLVEMGTRAGLGRHITFYLGKGDIPKVNGFLNTAMLIFLVTGVVLLLAASVLGAFFPALFNKIPDELIGSARMAIYLTALNLWLSFFSAAFTQIIVAQERFDFANAVNLGVLAIRTAGTVAALKMGGGIVELAAVQVVSSVAGVAACWWLARRVLPQMRLDLRLASRSHFRELFGFSVWSFVSGVAMQILYLSDTVIIGLLLGPAMVTFYAIPSMLILYSRGIVGECAAVFTPQILKICAQEDWEGLRHIILRSSNLVMAIGIPLIAGLSLYGRDFTRLWMGPQFDISYPVLVILAFAQLTSMGTMSLASIYAGLNRVRLGALLTIAQAVASLTLTLALLLIWHWGIEGVAWGAFVTRTAFGPIGGWFALRWIRFPGVAFLRGPVLRWTAALALLSLVLLAVEALWAASGWTVLATKNCHCLGRLRASCVVPALVR